MTVFVVVYAAIVGIMYVYNRSLILTDMIELRLNTVLCRTGF